ncbi:transglycosylase domain-containing protein [Pandoraea sp. B-6]|uniref:transglycosylase domain-containing protein n=1 Tax=Pandoraea sp. B-6 TaxID=1204340 RepID=UPI000344B7FF|nr:transglycosylase domain-containing protein [Pandoraea sp. B-6]
MNRPPANSTLRAVATKPFGIRLKWLLLLAAASLCAIGVYFVAREMQTSRLQAKYFAALDRQVSFRVAQGPSDTIRFPSHGGPYDLRMGYERLPEFAARLTARGFVVTAQARDSATMARIADQGLFVPYEEKAQAGLRLFDASGAPLYRARYPLRTYANFDAVPPVVADALTFIEDRSLLDAAEPYLNPAINWKRFSLAVIDLALKHVLHHHAMPGGSTLATQIEKYRHSPGGRTVNPSEKLRQMVSAALRAYLGGERTLPARRRIVVAYLNTEPLGAQPGIGEIEGIGDGLVAWYGRDFDEANHLLAALDTDARGQTGAPATGGLTNEALAFKQVLSLLIAQRAPSYFLTRNNAALETLTNSYLRLLADNHVISARLRDAALGQPLQVRHGLATAQAIPFAKRKAISVLRAHLLETLGLKNTYALDRLDLTASSTLADALEQAVSKQLARAQTVAGAQQAGLYGFEMLRPGDDPAKIAFSFSLYERRRGENVLRVQTDTVNEPFDINQGARLNLGSTAKLRTLVLYLQIVSDLHAHYASLTPPELARVKPDALDALTSWALNYLAHTTDHSLPAMLAAAVERKYSANPGEVFHTGSGEQAFSNFEPADNGRILTVHEAFQRSVNLVFVRLMRDIVHYEMVRQAGPSAHWLTDPVLRQQYLTRFADEESLTFLDRFNKRYAGLAADQAVAKLVAGMPKSPVRLAAALRSVAPDGSPAWFEGQMRAALKGTPAASMSAEEMAGLYAKYGPDKFDLNDRAYLARVHPVELWLLAYLRAHPQATESDLRDASRDVRLESYSWLFKTRFHATQDRRIRETIELQAYAPIVRAWRSLGYPFKRITPSYGCAIGAAGDRPAALATLMGIIANDGRKVQQESLSSLTFAAATPYETHFSHAFDVGQVVISPAIVDVVRGLLRDVVTGGTGKRLADGLPLGSGRTLEVYGKTGTGDQRFNVYARGAKLIESRKVNRTATFVFMIGNRFYGVLSAYVHEPYATHYTYTSAMAVQLLKSLGPTLGPLVGKTSVDQPLP